MAMVKAPWTDEQVMSLTAWQNNGYVHPYTCGQRDGHPLDPEGDYGVLVPTTDGWVCRHCDYTQEWAHDYSLNEAPPHGMTRFFGYSGDGLNTRITGWSR